MGLESSVHCHAANLKSQSQLWTQLKSNKTCLYCLHRAPEHVLTCQHAICDICVKRFGDQIPGYEYQYEISICILCVSKGKLRAQIKPPTAGIRILSIDGGGVRGIVPLEFLKLLQALIGPFVPIQDFFDMAFGTSSGKAFSFTSYLF